MCCAEGDIDTLQKTKDGEVKMVTIMLIGDPASCAKAKDMIAEAVENKEQKAKQRHKEYEKKRDAKVRCLALNLAIPYTLIFKRLQVPAVAAGILTSSAQPSSLLGSVKRLVVAHV